jgi:hypothetical protein
MKLMSDGRPSGGGLSCLDCESVESAVMSLADHYQASVADIIDFLNAASDDGLFESFEARFGPANTEWDSVCWFHLTRVPAGTDFSEGILPLHLALDKIWVAMAAILGPIQKANLQNLKVMGVPDDLYNLKIENMSCFAGPNAMLVKEAAFHSDEMGNHDYLAMPEIVEDICHGYEKQFGESIQEEIAAGLRKCIVKFDMKAEPGEQHAAEVLSYCWCKYHDQDLHNAANMCYDNGGKPVPYSAIRKIEFL